MGKSGERSKKLKKDTERPVTDYFQPSKAISDQSASKNNEDKMVDGTQERGTDDLQLESQNALKQMSKMELRILDSVKALVEPIQSQLNDIKQALQDVDKKADHATILRLAS
ncbi:UNVERIFIED_CONTAM: hypothetical protein K2H54_064448 [Gekko kuhli]